MPGLSGARDGEIPLYHSWELSEPIDAITFLRFFMPVMLQISTESFYSALQDKMLPSVITLLSKELLLPFQLCHLEISKIEVAFSSMATDELYFRVLTSEDNVHYKQLY